MRTRRHTWTKGLLACGLLLAHLSPHTAHAVTRTLVIDANTGTFSTSAGNNPWININSGDVVQFVGLERNDSIVRIASVPATANGTDVCYPYNAFATSQDAYVYKAPFNGSAFALNEFTGPMRQGLSGLWALAPEGGKISMAETVDAECSTLNYSTIAQYNNISYSYAYAYTEATFKNGEAGLPPLAGEEINIATGKTHRLCEATTTRCVVGGNGACTYMSNGAQNFDPLDPNAIPNGTYLGGLMASTYNNPDVTGVVIRLSWNDIQYDDGTGNIMFNWRHVDREFQRALTHGKFVTLDVRAGRYGTPDWIFHDYLDPASEHHAAWCTSSAAPCTLSGPGGVRPPGAGAVEPIEVKDYYDTSANCGTRFRIGHPGDPQYRSAYSHMIQSLIAHVAEDSRRFAALANVKVSGLNLQTSEAELPHHCDDLYLASGFPITAAERAASFVPVDIDNDDDYVTPGDIAPDNILDVWQKNGAGSTSTEECWCNPEIWARSIFGYTPDMVYEYYTNLQSDILNATFGKKSMGYQIIQDGFPEANYLPAIGGAFFGDHLYQERLVASTASGYEELSVNECITPDLASMAYSCASPTGLVEDQITGIPSYCSTDALGSTGPLANIHCDVQLKPLLESATQPGHRAYPEPEKKRLSQGGRYPKGIEQSEEVLLRARNGAFGAPANPAYVNTSLGKHFVPQHSGLQPLPAEQIELDYKAVGDEDTCVQQSAAMNPPPALPPQFAANAVGQRIAVFPMQSMTPGIQLIDQESEITDTYNGCPNRWIVQESAIPLANGGPPMMTGFQNTNNTRNLDHFESSLMNLVYNTNALFLEVYEDVFWRATVLRGNGPNAAPLSTPGLRAQGAGLCDYIDPITNVVDYRFCYSKNMSQWSEELHYRRWKAASLTNTALFPSFTDPFPTTYSFTFTNPTPGTPRDYYLINPARCKPSAIRPNGNAAANALVRIRVL